jgi:hypothetical protein
LWGPEEELRMDLEADKYIATVGYTANTFPSNARDPGLQQTLAVWTNVMFVIVLGIIA